MLLKDFIKSATERLSHIYPSPEARGIVIMLCEERLGVKSYTHIVAPEYTIKDSALETLEKDMERLSNAEPIQYVIGHCDFFGYRFNVAPGVLIPRPETEQLVSIALKALKCGKENISAIHTDRHTPKVLDLCTGSGCIAWSVALEASSAQVYGVDISREALSIAESQFTGNCHPPHFVEADILKSDTSGRAVIPDDIAAEGPFDIILSNPPYIMDSERSQMRPNVLRYEPKLALFVPDNNPLLFYDACARWTSGLLADGGMAVFEINERLGVQTMELLKRYGFKNVTLITDCFGKDRFVSFHR